MAEDLSEQVQIASDLMYADVYIAVYFWRGLAQNPQFSLHWDGWKAYIFQTKSKVLINT